jgi:hypothetical protein
MSDNIRIIRKFNRNYKNFNFPEFNIVEYLNEVKSLNLIKYINHHRDILKILLKKYTFIRFQKCCAKRSICNIGCKIIVYHNEIELVLGKDYAKYLYEFEKIYTNYPINRLLNPNIKIYTNYKLYIVFGSHNRFRPTKEELQDNKIFVIVFNYNIDRTQYRNLNINIMEYYIHVMKYKALYGFSEYETSYVSTKINNTNEIPKEFLKPCIMTKSAKF